MWEIFDKIYVFLDTKDLENSSILVQNIKNRFLKDYNFNNLDNVQFVQLRINNPVIKSIWDYQIKHRLIYNYYNTYINSDFKAFFDYESSIKKIEIVKECLLLGYDKILIFEPGYFKHNYSPTNFINKIKNLPNLDDLNKIILLIYDKINEPVQVINKYWIDIQYSISKDVKSYILTKLAMKHILNNFEMIPKSFQWYLFQHTMLYDSYIQRIASTKYY